MTVRAVLALSVLLAVWIGSGICQDLSRKKRGSGLKVGSNPPMLCKLMVLTTFLRNLEKGRRSIFLIGQNRGMKKVRSGQNIILCQRKFFLWCENILIIAGIRYTM
jgi:hypothetical protein